MAYDTAFFEDIEQSSSASARIVVPWIVSLIQPTSVVDVGCGVGNWLREYLRQGPIKVLGVDGPWVPLDKLQIPSSSFIAADLTGPLDSVPRNNYDLVQSLEVAEHLSPDCAGQFVTALTNLGPCVLFSAAAPGQGGIAHVNEQWPSYWIDLFESNGYVCVDCVRGRLWDEKAVAPWYAQNAFFFIRSATLHCYPQINTAEEAYSLGKKALIHPRQYQQKVDQLSDPTTYSGKKILKALPSLLARATHARLSRIVSGQG